MSNSNLTFSLLGQAVIGKDGKALDRFRSQSERALLIYLAHTGKVHQRAFLADLLWESRSQKQALTNLRTVLSRLRKQVGDALLITRQTLAVTSETKQHVDSVRLLNVLTTIGQIDSDEKAVTLQKELDLYRGPFLADFTLEDAPRFEEWVVITREQIRRQVIVAYDKLGQYALASGDAENGIAITRRWLEVDGLDEAAHTLLIRLLLTAGRTREATDHYAYCADLFRKELDVAPPAEMTTWIKNAQPKPVVIYPPNIRRHNLPAPYDEFFGRKIVQQEIHSRLDQTWCRLVTLVGPGGVGKTRLATHIARSRIDHYRDGVYLVELADVDADDDDLAETIAVEIAIALDLRLTGAKKPIEQLLNHLQHKQMLLVLDNFEHLLAGFQIVGDIVRQCEEVQLLITSREALGLRAEWRIALVGLGYPAGEMDDTPSDAVDLFVARYAQQRHEELPEDEFTAVREISRMLEGLPLALELAAALARDTTSQAVADQIRSGFDALTTPLRDMPERHRSLQVVFEMSWQTLSSTLQRRLVQLSIFRGGFEAGAARQIAAADAHHLAALGEKSLISSDAATGRHSLHAVVRAFAATKDLHDDETVQKHARFYLALLAEHTKPLQGNAPQTSIYALHPDIENVRRAWQTALAQGRSAATRLLKGLTSLSIYYQLRGLALEGEAVMQATFRTAQTWGSEGIALATQAGLERARFQNRLGRNRPAIATIEATLQLADQSGDRWVEGMGHVWWGEALWRLGEYDASLEKLNHALDIAEAIDAPLILGWCHHQMGIVADIQSHYEQAHTHFEQACETWRSLNNAQALSASLNSIGLVRYHQGDLPAAQDAMEQALTLCNQLDNRHLQALLLNNLSIIATQQGDYTGAEHYLRLGLRLANASGNLSGQGEIYNNLGKNYLLMGESDLAIDSLEQGLQISEMIENRSLIAAATINMADTKREQGNFEDAESLYRRALEVARQNRLKRIECEALIGMAELLSAYDIQRAKQVSTEAVLVAKTIQDPRLLRRANNIDRYVNVSATVNEKNLSE